MKTTVTNNQVTPQLINQLCRAGEQQQLEQQNN